LFCEKNLPLKYHSAAQFACAAGAFLACSILLVPGEVLKVRMQAGAVNSLSAGIKSIFVQDGLGGFFAGYGATLLRDVPYTMLELGIYENLKSIIRKHKQTELSQQEELFAAAFTGFHLDYIHSFG
jgi:solute carrier family 25 S-adenosylmethionine transporter 26